MQVVPFLLLLMNFFQVLNGIEGVSLANDICRNYRREGYPS